MEKIELNTLHVHWPAIIHYHGQAELAFIFDQVAWESAQYLQALRYHASDVLIDVEGALYQLVNAEVGNPGLQSLNKKASLQQVIEMIRGHAAEVGACCVAKFSAVSIEEAIASLASSIDG
jgi:hypothetical protein